MNHAFFSDLALLIPDVAPDSIVSRTYFDGDELKAILFGFASGQELSEHTASKAAVLHFLSGEARLTLGDEDREARPGTWVYMPPKLPHSVRAETPMIMLLLLLG